MFPISSEGVSEDPSIFFEQDNYFLEDLLADCPIPEGNGQVEMRSRKASSSSEAKENNEGSSGSKKTAHKFVEKQRRQGMSALYASLRSLLPLQYVKGKRAISDHMQQAVIYIEDTKKRMEGMKRRRDELRKLSTSGINVDDVQNVDGGDSANCVKINVLIDGMEILISSGLNKETSPLSKVLADLLGRDLNVINCASTRAARCYLHKIQIELNDSASMDIAELQREVEKLIRFD